MAKISKADNWEIRPDGSNNLVAADAVAALATDATKGFLWLPTCAGTPTGVPSPTYTGAAAFVYDTSGNKIWVYDGGWIGVAVS